MKKELSALEAKNEAQKLAFAPIYFHAAMSLWQLGILQLLRKNKKGMTIKEIADTLNLSEYGVQVLLEAGAEINVVDYVNEDRVVISKIGLLLNSDRMTQVNFNFMNVEAGSVF